MRQTAQILALLILFGPFLGPPVRAEEAATALGEAKKKPAVSAKKRQAMERKIYRALWAGELAAALKDSQALSGLAPDDLRLKARIAQIHLKMKKWDLALAEAKAILKIDAHQPRASSVRWSALIGQAGVAEKKPEGEKAPKKDAPEKKAPLKEKAAEGKKDEKKTPEELRAATLKKVNGEVQAFVKRVGGLPKPAAWELELFLYAQELLANRKAVEAAYVQLAAAYPGGPFVAEEVARHSAVLPDPASRDRLVFLIQKLPAASATRIALEKRFTPTFHHLCAQKPANMPGMKIWGQLWVVSLQAEEAAKWGSQAEQFERVADRMIGTDNLGVFFTRQSFYLKAAESYEADKKPKQALTAYGKFLSSGVWNMAIDAKARALYRKTVRGDKRKTIGLWAAEQAGMTVPQFADTTRRMGLGRVRASRVAFADYSGDGRDDLLAGGVLFKKIGPKFVRASKKTLPAGVGDGIWGDFNNDGRPDLLTQSDQVYQNVKGRRLVKRADLKDGHPTEASSWGDFNGDGFLDLYIANYETKDGFTPDRYYTGDGKGAFADLSGRAGVQDVPPEAGRGVTTCDYDEDGDLDLFVANYRLRPNFLWKNDGKGKFTDVAAAAGVQGNRLVVGDDAAFGHSIGPVFGDIDNDGDMDLLVPNLAHWDKRFVFSDLTMLLINGGKKAGYTFTDERLARGIQFEETHSDGSMADVDNDGDLDLFITSVYENHPAYLYLNDGTGHFTNVTWYAGLQIDDGWGSAWSDIDNDGDLDLVVTGSTLTATDREALAKLEAEKKKRKGKLSVLKKRKYDKLLKKKGRFLRLFTNRTKNDNHWLKVRLVGTHCNRDAIGARVRVTAKGVTRTRDRVGSRGTSSQDSPTLHFGLGLAPGELKVQVRWPCGKVTTQTAKSNRTLTIKEK